MQKKLSASYSKWIVKERAKWGTLCPGLLLSGIYSSSCVSCPIPVQGIKPLTGCEVRKGFSLSEGNRWKGLLHAFTVRCVLWAAGSSAYFHMANPCCFRDQICWRCCWFHGVSKEHFKLWGCFWTGGEWMLQNPSQQKLQMGSWPIFSLHQIHPAWRTTSPNVPSLPWANKAEPGAP